MKLYKILLNEIIDAVLFEQAYRLKLVRSDIISKRNQIARHILKLIFYKENENTNQWISEIKSWLVDIKTESYNKIDRKEFYNLLYKDVFDDTTVITDSIQLFKDKYYLICNKFSNQNEDEITSKLEIIYNVICNYLTSNNINIDIVDKNLRNIKKNKE